MGNPALAAVLTAYRDCGRDIEIIVVVDKPDCDLGFLAPELLADRKVIVLRNERNLGLPQTLNRGMERASGDIIIRNDDDDIPHADRVADVLAFFEAHADVDIAYGFADGLDQESSRTWAIRGPSTDQEIKKELLRRNFIVHSALAFRKAAIERIGGYNPTFRYAQDYELYLRAIRKGLRFGCIERAVVTRVYHAEATTVKRRRRQILYSFAARLIHHAEGKEEPQPVATVLSYLRLLLIPNALRALRRRLGHGR
jgi:GT2 family glycosyltransferase